MLTSMFGITKGEVAAGFSPGYVGNVIDLACASPWAVQFSKDLDRLSLFDEGQSFLDSIGDQKLSIFTCAETSEDFQAIDMAQLRAAELSAAFAPPGFEYALDTGDDDDMHAPGIFGCALCDVTFATKQSLLLHLRKNTLCASARTLLLYLSSVPRAK